MKNFLKRRFTDGKNIVSTYYIRNLVNYFVPKFVFRCSMKRVVNNASKRDDYDYIIERVNYYNKLDEKRDLSQDKVYLKDFLFKGGKKVGSRYFFDTYEHLRCFNQDLSFDYLYGDITYVPQTPKIIKSRPISEDNANSVLLNLDKLRHFVFLNDITPFREKEGSAIFLSFIKDKPHRVDFMEKFHNSEICLCGDVQNHEKDSPWYNEQWHYEKISLWEHLNYKFILTLEGNDVASNLKWVMSSNSIAVMPKPKYETWFMEGKLIGGYHYIEIKSDYSDFEEKVNYYNEHPEEAERISKNAHEYIKQFQNNRREKIISYLVLEKYLNMVNQ